MLKGRKRQEKVRGKNYYHFNFMILSNEGAWLKSHVPNRLCKWEYGFWRLYSIVSTWAIASKTSDCILPVTVIYYYFLNVTWLETFIDAIFIHHRTCSKEKSSFNFFKYFFFKKKDLTLTNANLHLVKVTNNWLLWQYLEFCLTATVKNQVEIAQEMDGD